MADDRSGEEQSSGPLPPPVIPEEDRIYLSSQPDGVWWEDKRIVELLGRSFTDTYHEYVTCWSDASARQRDAMYQYFAVQIQGSPNYTLLHTYVSNNIHTHEGYQESPSPSSHGPPQSKFKYNPEGSFDLSSFN
ncbi:hypothetical protein OROMI_023279 [Orobanche minor]